MLLNLQDNLSAEENKKLKTEFSKRLANRIREVRKSKKKTQQEVAEKAGLHLTYLGHLELGKYHPTAFVIWKVAKALEVPIETLLDL
jgi:transcriptional regulator with XRE-family HTH domain